MCVVFMYSMYVFCVCMCGMCVHMCLCVFNFIYWFYVFVQRAQFFPLECSALLNMSLSFHGIFFQMKPMCVVKEGLVAQAWKIQCSMLLYRGKCLL